MQQRQKMKLLGGAILMAAAGLAYGQSGGAACGLPALAQCPTPIDKVLPDVKNMLTWSQAERLIGFRNDYRNYPGDVFKHGIPFPLPAAEKPIVNVSYRFQGRQYHLSDYLQRENVTGLLVIKKGHIAYEYYGGGNNKTTLWTSRSVAKSVVSTLVGVAIKEGKIKSLNDKLTDYNPALNNTAWRDVTLKELIQHTSGVRWNEDYTNPHSDFAKLTQCEAGKATYQCVKNLVYHVKRLPHVKPGEVWSYNTGGAWLLGDILERATGQSLAHYLQEKIWIPFGMESDGVWHAYQPGKHDMGGHGFNATLEDWGRFGLFVLRNGELANGKKILPDNWVKQASDWNKAKNSVTAAYPQGTHGYQWWNNSIPANIRGVLSRERTMDNRTLWALGIYGQIIAINQEDDLIMVQWSTWRQAEPPSVTKQLEASLLFNAIAQSLK